MDSRAPSRRRGKPARMRHSRIAARVASSATGRAGFPRVEWSAQHVRKGEGRPLLKDMGIVQMTKPSGHSSRMKPRVVASVRSTLDAFPIRLPAIGETLRLGGRYTSYRQYTRR